jgi:Fe2+ transport system protein B
MMDEAEKLGKKIRVEILEEELQTPVVPTVSTTGKGIDILKGKIEEYVRKSRQKDKV